jgi:polyvinyl alcohol dehydrogenase (cytochrome)
MVSDCEDFRMKRSYLLLIASAFAYAADDPYVAALFQKHCASCHQNTEAAGRIPQIEDLKTRSSRSILRTLETGAMKQQASALSANERLFLANLLGKPVTMELPREQISNSCPQGAAWKSTSGWSGWSPGLVNTRFQSAEAAGLSAANVPRLQLKWVFAFPDTTSMRSQPAVYRGRVYVGGQDGAVYSLDAVTGCTHWSTEVNAEVRSGITVADVAGKPTVFFGDSSGYYYALDGETGKQLWQLRPDDHPATKATGTPVFYQERVYIGVSSLEEGLGLAAGYACCTFRGSESAVDAATGKVIWKRYMIPDVAKPQRNTQRGAPVMGPSGAGVWNAATLDPEHDRMFVNTGDNYSDPTTSTSDAVVALRMSTGEILWSKQFTAKDAWNSACGFYPGTYVEGGEKCPNSDGPDFDFASSSILVQLPNGRRALLLGQKSGMVYAVDPDRNGQILWQTRAGKGGNGGGIEWGMASDGRNLYAAVADLGVKILPGTGQRQSIIDPEKGGGILAFRVDNGERVWQTAPPGCGGKTACSPAQSAAVTGIPGAVFSGSMDGHLRAYATDTGRIIWDFDTAREFKTINGIAGHGGAIDGPGPVVANGMLYAISGRSNRGLMPGNVLIAFSTEP